jgi:hypothetical protein
MDAIGILNIFLFFLLAGIMSSVILVSFGRYSFWLACTLEIILIITLQGISLSNLLLYCLTGAALFIPIFINYERSRRFLLPFIGIIAGSLLSTIVCIAITLAIARWT